MDAADKENAATIVVPTQRKSMDRNEMKKKRRQSVSGESYDPYSLENNDNYERVVVPKSDEAYKRIEASVKDNLMFRNLDSSQGKEVYDAMFERTVEEGEAVIKQGDDGDYFYVVDEGSFDVFVNDKKVVTVEAGGSFGELALMYNSPRAATVVATCPSVLWALDRKTFRHILVQTMAKKRRMFEGFLENVPVMKSLHPNERFKAVDAFEEITYKKGDEVVTQGDKECVNFYIVAEGEVAVEKSKGDKCAQVATIGEGGYFGEVALLLDEPRGATVRVTSDVAKCLALNRAAFVRLLGPVRDILARNMENYRSVEEAIADGRAN
eukprot:Nk52_evm39s1737 gene=Nk52_evmTU39s1737